MKYEFNPTLPLQFMYASPEYLRGITKEYIEGLEYGNDTIQPNIIYIMRIDGWKYYLMMMDTSSHTLRYRYIELNHTEQHGWYRRNIDSVIVKTWHVITAGNAEWSQLKPLNFINWRVSPFEVKS